MAAMTRRLLLGALWGAPWAFPKSWDTPVFPGWSPEFIDKLLTDSPWATESTVKVDLDRIERRLFQSFQQVELPAGIGLPRTGSSSRLPGVGWPRRGPATGGRFPPPVSRPSGDGGGRSGATGEIFLTTRWASALPIRRAKALQHFGRARLESQEAVALLDTPPVDYVIEIAGFPTNVVRGNAERFAKDLQDSARLTVQGRKPLSATSSAMPEPGMHLMATLTFPRFEDLGPKEGSIELSAAARGIKLHQRFKLKEMIYKGNLEL